MRTQIDIDGKKVEVEWTTAAGDALTKRAVPLLAEMELYFSCLIRKQVRFHDATDATGIAAGDKLRVRFRPVMTAVCGKDYEGSEPPLTDFPIVKAQAYVPHWLRIDFRNGQWQGEFGYGAA